MEFYLPEFWTVVKGPHKEDVHPTLQYSLTTSVWAKKSKHTCNLHHKKTKMSIYIIRKNYRNVSLPECSRRFAGNCGGHVLWGKLMQSVTLKQKSKGIPWALHESNIFLALVLRQQIFSASTWICAMTRLIMSTLKITNLPSIFWLILLVWSQNIEKTLSLYRWNGDETRFVYID